jgi:subtilisin-like proprotein convertase family protein
MEQAPTRRVTRRSGTLVLAAALIAGAMASVVGAPPAGAASTATVKSTTPIVTPATGQANPYPSTISVSGLGTSLLSMKVVLRNVSHTCTKDLDVLLEAPDGSKTTLFSDNGAPAIQFDGCTDLTKQAITIDDSCVDFANAMPGGEGSSAPICVRPSDNDSLGHQGDDFGSVGSDFPALNLSTFAGKNPNGTWKLYVVDDANDDSGSIAGGWELQLNTSNSPPQAEPQVIEVNKGAAKAFTLTGTDPDGDALTCVVPGTTTQGKGVLGGSGCNRTYTANPRTSGTDGFAFRVRDDDAAQSPNASVVFNIVNRPPTANDVSIQVGRNERVALTLAGTDPDPGEGLALTCAPTLGATTLGSVSGSGCNVTYAAGNVNGADSFAYSVADGFGGLDAGTITIQVVDPVLPGCSPSDSKNARYVCRVYLDLLGRAADPGGKAFWLRKVDAGESRVGIIRKYQTTPEYRRRVVDDVYKTFLQRNPDKSGQTYWAEQVRKGVNPDQLRAQVIGSNEYWNKSGASAAGFAAAIYQQVTRTPATPAQVASVTSQLAAGKTRSSIAAALLATPAGDTATVKGIYERYLRRTPPSSEVTFWVNRLQSGVTELKIVESTVSSNEYFNRS